MAGAHFGSVPPFHLDCGQHHDYDFLRRIGSRPEFRCPDRGGWDYPSFAILWLNINPLILLYTHDGARR
jgi:hypothetical protein